jgi:CoA-dependent NAD(P)H sulfur oxidoreductase
VTTPGWQQQDLEQHRREDTLLRLIIVGGVAAGAKAAARARRINPDMAITLYQDEAEVSYSACGQPYYLSGSIANRNALIIRRADQFKEDGIEVRVHHRVTDLDTLAHTLQVHNLVSGSIESVAYDRLIIATGARPTIPSIAGIEADGVVSLRSWAELDNFHSALTRLRPTNAVIIGGGYIGLEVAESLQALGIGVTVLERSARLYSRLDAELSQRVHDYLLSEGVGVMVGDAVAEIMTESGCVVGVRTMTGQILPAELVVVAVGIRPNVDLVQGTTIKLGTTGAIAVDSSMQTNIEGIFAAGDCAESRHRITGEHVWEPLGDIANLQGRIAGENAAGGKAEFPGVLGTGIFKVLRLCVGMTGLTETASRAAGLEPIAVTINARDKARYYPGAQELSLKLIAESRSGRILGAQTLGFGGVDKMTDIAATALLGGLTCWDLANADLAYAPPFSPVMSPIIVAAGAISGKLKA